MSDNPELCDGVTELEEARAAVRRIRQLVVQRKVGASSLAVAEYKLNCALNRVDKLQRDLAEDHDRTSRRRDVSTGSESS